MDKITDGTFLTDPVQFATEKSWDDLQVRIYPGADGEFTLYEDEDDNYNYEKGKYTTVRMLHPLPEGRPAAG